MEVLTGPATEGVEGLGERAHAELREQCPACKSSISLTVAYGARVRGVGPHRDAVAFIVHTWLKADKSQLTGSDLCHVFGCSVSCRCTTTGSCPRNQPPTPGHAAEMHSVSWPLQPSAPICPSFPGGMLSSLSWSVHGIPCLASHGHSSAQGLAGLGSVHRVAGTSEEGTGEEGERRR